MKNKLLILHMYYMIKSEVRSIQLQSDTRLVVNYGFPTNYKSVSLFEILISISQRI